MNWKASARLIRSGGRGAIIGLANGPSSAHLKVIHLRSPDVTELLPRGIQYLDRTRTNVCNVPAWRYLTIEAAMVVARRSILGIVSVA